MFVVMLLRRRESVIKNSSFTKPLNIGLPRTVYML